MLSIYVTLLLVTYVMKVCNAASCYICYEGMWCCFLLHMLSIYVTLLLATYVIKICNAASCYICYEDMWCCFLLHMLSIYVMLLLVTYVMKVCNAASCYICYEGMWCCFLLHMLSIYVTLLLATYVIKICDADSCYNNGDDSTPHYKDRLDWRPLVRTHYGTSPVNIKLMVYQIATVSILFDILACTYTDCQRLLNIVIIYIMWWTCFGVAVSIWILIVFVCSKNAFIPTI